MKTKNKKHGNVTDKRLMDKRLMDKRLMDKAVDSWQTPFLQGETFDPNFVLSKKYERGWFSYSKTETYVVYGKELPHVVFDMSEIGQDPIKLLRTMLVWWKYPADYYSSSVHRVIYNSLDDLLNPMLGRNRTMNISLEYQAPTVNAYALVILLSAYPQKCPTFRKVVIDVLTEFLGARAKNSHMWAHSNAYGASIFGPQLRETDLRTDQEVASQIGCYIPYMAEITSDRKLDLRTQKKQDSEKRASSEYLTRFIMCSKSEVDYTFGNMPSLYNSSTNKTRKDYSLDALYKNSAKYVPNYMVGRCKKAFSEEEGVMVDGVCSLCWLVGQPGWNRKHRCRRHNPKEVVSQQQVPPQRTLGSELASISAAVVSSNIIHPEPSAPPAEIDDERRLECCICSGELNCVLVPCGHPACFQCAGQVKECPICRSTISSLQKLFL